MRAKRIIAAILALVFFFYGWMQFHHRHGDAVDYLNPGGSTGHAIVVGAHCHSSDTDFPLFENLRIVIKPVLFNCLLCTFDRLVLPPPSVNEADFTLKETKTGRITTDLAFKVNASITYNLRAPPVLFPF